MDEFYYQSLPLCVIDAIFSINAKYTAAQNVGIRFCKYFGLNRINRQKPGPIEDQLSISAFIASYDRLGMQGMVEKIYDNRQRTSPRNGILKAEAVLEFARVLQQFGVEYLQDVGKIIGNPAFEKEVKKIPGQGSGISLRIFYAMVGSDHQITPSRMIVRFVETALHRSIDIEDCTPAIVGSCTMLLPEYPHLTPRLLDHAIWQYQTALESTV